eukprot:scaffold44403_cov359-Amphora_coffeaeformis.AAC.1
MALKIINKSRPTPCACHIKTQYYVIQEWQKARDILIAHVSGTINLSSALTKAVTAVLYYRNCPCVMGHYLPNFNEGSGSTPMSPILVGLEPSKAGESSWFSQALLLGSDGEGAGGGAQMVGPWSKFGGFPKQETEGFIRNATIQ